MMEDYERFDFIFRLTRLSHLNHIAEKILGFLDYVDLNHAELSSPVWSDAIAQGNLWKGVLHKQLVLNSSWEKMYNILEQKSFSGMANRTQQGTPAFYREVCHYIAESIKRMEENWNIGQGYEDSEKYLQFRNCKPVEQNVKMNEKWIVRSNSNGSLEIFNRWTCVLEKLFETDNLLTFYLSCFDFDNAYVVAGLLSPRNICIWSMASGELIHDIKADDEDPQPNQGSDVIIVQAYRSNRILAVERYNEPDLCQVLIRKMPGAEVTHRLTTTNREIRDANSDEDHLILLVVYNNFVVNAKLEIRALDSMDAILRTIDVCHPSSSFPSSFSYSKGLVMVGWSDFARVWNVNGQRIWTLPEKGHRDLVTPKLVNGKYVVVGHLNSGKVTIFNLDGGAGSRNSGNDHHQIDGVHYRLPYYSLGLLADEYQIFSFGRRFSVSSRVHDDMLNVVDFLPDP